MYLVPIGWLYVALMMAVAEANHADGSIFGAILTFLLYGVAPVSLVVYLMGRKGRRARAAQDAERDVAGDAMGSGEPDAGGKPAADTVAPMREKP